jgi:hypothetical protein
MALGIMDTYASGVLCEALACRTPITAVATLSSRLWPHPAWAGHLRTLTDAGVTFVNPISGRVGEVEPVQSGTGQRMVQNFSPFRFAQTVGAPRS